MMVAMVQVPMCPDIVWQSRVKEGLQHRSYPLFRCVLFIESIIVELPIIFVS